MSQTFPVFQLILKLKVYFLCSVQLKHFQKFIDTTEALAATTSAIEGKVPKSLRKTLKTIFAEEAHEALAVADAKLGSAIKGSLN